MTPCTLHCLISAKAVEKNLNKNAVSKSDNGGSFQHSPSFILYPFIHLGSKDCQNLGYPAPLDQNRLMDKLRMLTPHIRLYKPASQSTNSLGDSHPYQILATTVGDLFFRCYRHFLLPLPSTVKDGVWCPFAYLGCQYRKTCRSNISEQKRWGSKELEVQAVFQMLEYLHLLNEMS